MSMNEQLRKANGQVVLGSKPLSLDMRMLLVSVEANLYPKLPSFRCLIFTDNPFPYFVSILLCQRPSTDEEYLHSSDGEQDSLFYDALALSVRGPRRHPLVHVSTKESPSRSKSTNKSRTKTLQLPSKAPVLGSPRGSLRQPQTSYSAYYKDMSRVGTPRTLQSASGAKRRKDLSVSFAEAAPMTDSDECNPEILDSGNLNNGATRGDGEKERVSDDSKLPSLPGSQRDNTRGRLAASSMFSAPSILIDAAEELAAKHSLQPVAEQKAGFAVDWGSTLLSARGTSRHARLLSSPSRGDATEKGPSGRTGLALETSSVVFGHDVSAVSSTVSAKDRKGGGGQAQFGYASTRDGLYRLWEVDQVVPTVDSWPADTRDRVSKAKHDKEHFKELQQRERKREKDRKERERQKASYANRKGTRQTEAISGQRDTKGGKDAVVTDEKEDQDYGRGVYSSQDCGNSRPTTGDVSSRLSLLPPAGASAPPFLQKITRFITEELSYAESHKLPIGSPAVENGEAFGADSGSLNSFLTPLYNKLLRRNTEQSKRLMVFQQVRARVSSVAE